MRNTFNMDAVWYFVICTVPGSFLLRATPPVHEVTKGRSDCLDDLGRLIR